MFEKLKYIKKIEDISKYSKYISNNALLDVRSRLGDYSLSIGKEIDENDNYLYQQLRYLDNIVKMNIKNEVNL